MKKEFYIKPKGKLKKGYCWYEIDEAKGCVNYGIEAEIKILLFTKNMNFSGSYPVDLELLKPACLKQQSKKIQIGGVILQVRHSDEQTSQVSLFLDDDVDLNGQFLMDITGKYGIIIDGYCFLDVMGMRFELVLVPK